LRPTRTPDHILKVSVPAAEARGLLQQIEIPSGHEIRHKKVYFPNARIGTVKLQCGLPGRNLFPGDP